jgi:hypothetical protein
MRSDLDICIVTDKWCDGNPNAGISNNYNNIILSLSKSIKNIDISLLHYDELIQKHSKHIDSILPNVSADVFIFCFLGNSPINPSPIALERTKGKKIFMWPDTVWPWITDTVQSVNQFADVHVAFDGLPNRSLLKEECLAKFAGKGINGITPQNPELFYPEEKIYDLCFLGTVHSNRAPYLEVIQNCKELKCVVGGGQRAGKLSAKDYAKVIRQSRMCLNLPLSPTGNRQLKGRVIESMASKTCLIEEIPSPIESILEQDQYMQIQNCKELIDTILSKTDGEICEMADKAYSVYNNYYSPEKYWNNLLSLID